MRPFTLATLTLLLLPACSILDIGRRQKQAPPHPEVDFTSIGPVLTATSADDPPAEKKFKNIQVLQGLPSSQLYPVMTHMANSLGVTCAHCHSEYFEEESRIEKQVARQMIRMTRGINRAQFQGQPTVSCYTCHRGHEYPSSAPLIEQAGWQKMLQRPSVKDVPLPDLDSVLARYEAAIGPDRQAAPPVLTGEISLVGGLDERASGRFEMTRGVDGSIEIKTPLRTPPPLTKALSRYRFGRLNLKEMYSDMTVTRRATIDGREATIVAAEPAEGAPENLAFDAGTGLLLRVQTGTSTELGWVPEEISFSDGSMAGGVWSPGTIRWARGDFLITLRFRGAPASSRPLVTLEEKVEK